MYHHDISQCDDRGLQLDFAVIVGCLVFVTSQFSFFFEDNTPSELDHFGLIRKN